MARKSRTTKNKRERELMALIYGPQHADDPMYRTVHSVHNTIVCYCDYCGKPMNASERNDFGSLCERCYIREYYDK